MEKVKLSRKEKAVIRYMAEGMAMVDIASQPDITLKKNSLDLLKHRLQVKLGLNGRCQLMVWACKNGIV